MREFSVETVVVMGDDGRLRSHRFSEILPHSFGPDTLENGQKKG
jgi:cytidine deaminase